MVKYSMTAQTEHVLQKLFSENSVEKIPLDRLKQIVDEHPYFTLGHLLLAKKLQTINTEEFEAQSEKASLYFNEPIWLQTLLNPPAASEFTIREGIAEEIIALEEGVIEEAVPEEDFLEKPISQETTVEEAISEEPIPEILPIEEKAQVEEDVKNEQPERESTHQLADVVTEKAGDASQAFEPYHTIDYFASQGIKVSNVIKSDDRLSQQLRSFTEWLKTMKRLPETQVDAQLDAVTQHNIQEIAAHSLDDKEIVTESMAEVLVKQNKGDEAIVIYEKLSLLNPSKRAYFAAKIEQLKGL
ncbi:MAG TPA: hypothetical protein VEV87_05590 [Chitinophagaceae bacterium]|nr:hypothetical protein [Chitinophagaceae bacterium]